MEQNTLTELVRRCQQGDREAQEKLILATQDHIYYHCRKMLRHEEDALDATQEILISMLQGVDKLREPAAFWGWLNRMIANRCKNLLTRGPKESQIPEDEEGNSLLDTFETLDEQTVPDKALDNEETRRMITELVDALPEAQRLCVLMFYYDEMSVKDIAAALETSEGTVKSRLNYGRKAIKEGVQRYEAQGVKLYSIAPLPLLFYFLRQDASACQIAPEAAVALSGRVLASAAAEQATASASVAGTKTAASGVAKAAAAKTGAGLGAKLVAGVLATAVVAGGVTVGARQLHKTGDNTSMSSSAAVSDISTPAEKPTVSPTVRYGAYRDLLLSLPQQYDLNEEFGSRFALYDCDGDGEDELLSVMTVGIGYLIGSVYDVNDQGEVFQLCQWQDERLVNAGDGALSLGIVKADEVGATPYFAMCFSASASGDATDEFYSYISNDHFKLYRIEPNSLTEQYDLSGSAVYYHSYASDSLERIEWRKCTLNGRTADAAVLGQVIHSFRPYIACFDESIFEYGDRNREIVNVDGSVQTVAMDEISFSFKDCIQRCENYINAAND